MRLMTYSPLLWVTHPLNGSLWMRGIPLWPWDHTDCLTGILHQPCCHVAAYGWWSFRGLPQQQTANTDTSELNGYTVVFSCCSPLTTLLTNDCYCCMLVICRWWNGVFLHSRQSLVLIHFTFWPQHFGDSLFMCLRTLCRAGPYDLKWTSRLIEHFTLIATNERLFYFCFLPS